MKIKLFARTTASLLLMTMWLSSCTNLEIEETDSIISEDTATGFTGLTDPASSLNDLYNTVGGDFQTQENIYALQEVSTDELLVPTRGTDWGDNGIWRQLHNHTWGADHLFVLRAWNALNRSIFRATEIIESDASAQVEAEAKFLRAFNMFFVLDLFGQVPFRGVDEGPEIDPTVLTSIEAYNFILTDLQEALPGLPDGNGVANAEIATVPAANFLLAKLYLNAHIYNGTGSPDNAVMQNVIDAVDAIAAEGYALDEGYFDIFEPTEDTETIFYLRSEVGARIWNTLHYNINSPDNGGGGWNGFSTLAEFYDTFEGDPNTNYVGDGQEERRGWVPDASNANNQNLGIGYGFLIDQQYNEDGTMLTDRQQNPLAFEKEIVSLVGNDEKTGIRVIKYHPYDPTDTEDTDSPMINSFRRHIIAFRYADAHLMKAEAMMLMGGDPTAMVNDLRTLRGAGSILGTVSPDDLLAERGRELYIEYWRRNDLIRFGQFTAPWTLKEVTGDDTKTLYPIPQTALLSNPNLVQNPGY